MKPLTLVTVVFSASVLFAQPAAETTIRRIDPALDKVLSPEPLVKAAMKYKSDDDDD